MSLSSDCYFQKRLTSSSWLICHCDVESLRNKSVWVKSEYVNPYDFRSALTKWNLSFCFATKISFYALEPRFLIYFRWHERAMKLVKHAYFFLWCLVLVVVGEICLLRNGESAAYKPLPIQWFQMILRVFYRLKPHSGIGVHNYIVGLCQVIISLPKNILSYQLMHSQIVLAFICTKRCLVKQNK